ncbi:hypothetical protein E2C01_084577 [Portunus trituberculatus]|uniref:Uncharacterized protein n=1 Tax=Portunus trituberculatus TaxID=210409 RepID=A0A5B7J580_PORTR|nr:hypothetical protein [Portunus trituberculatus]
MLVAWRLGHEWCEACLYSGGVCRAGKKITNTIMGGLTSGTAGPSLRDPHPATHCRLPISPQLHASDTVPFLLVRLQHASSVNIVNHVTVTPSEALFTLSVSGFLVPLAPNSQWPYSSPTTAKGSFY